MRSGGRLSSIQRARADQLTNIFEFSDPHPQYGSVENLGDGRGITFGRAGFCTGTGDGLAVVEEYMKRSPTTSGALAAYLPALHRINDARQGETNPDITGLDGFGAAVTAAATSDAAFRRAQDSVVNSLYYIPSQALSDQLGLQFALSRAALYDAYIQHGENSPEDDFWPESANGMAAFTSTALGGSPGQGGVDEVAWLYAFLARRKVVLRSTSDPSWAEGTNRVEIYEWLLDAQVYDLDRMIVLQEGECGPSRRGPCSVDADAVVVGPCEYGSFSIP